LKLIILKVCPTHRCSIETITEFIKHLPVLVFNASKEFEAKDSAISSIYYDNPDTWELYMGRLKKTEGAEAIRLRWYGGMETETVFVERKTHREDWTGEKSVKARFSMKEKNVNAFLSGKMNVESVFEKMRKEGKKSEKEIADLEQLAREIQYRVITRSFVPVTRSFYNRTAFQLPGDARVRISLDTELTMVREDNLDGRERAGKNWRRMDIGIEYPFKQLPPEDVERFPYAVLEVKLQTQAGQQPPEWVRELISSHLVEAVPKFSKFIHGTATLFPTGIHLLPFWMPQMDVDIRKPITHRFGIERPNQAASYSTSDDPLDTDTEDEEENERVQGNTDAPQEDENTATDQGMRRLREARDTMEQHDITHASDPTNTLDIEERIAADPLSYPDDDPIYDSDDETDDLEEAKRVGGWHYRRKLLKHHIVHAPSYLIDLFRNMMSIANPTTPSPTPQPTSRHFRAPSYLIDLFRNMMSIANPTTPSPTPQPTSRHFRAPPGKRIHVPVRVEPKVFFATERTFLSWLEFSILLGSIAATLLNFGDGLSHYSAWGFTFLAIASLLYSLGIYLWRVRMIRRRRTGGYHDWFGPSVLCAGLLAAVVVSFVVRVRGVGWVG